MEDWLRAPALHHPHNVWRECFEPRLVFLPFCGGNGIAMFVGLHVTLCDCWEGYLPGYILEPDHCALEGRKKCLNLDFGVITLCNCHYCLIIWIFETASVTIPLKTSNKMPPFLPLPPPPHRNFNWVAVMLDTQPHGT